MISAKEERRVGPARGKLRGGAATFAAFAMYSLRRFIATAAFRRRARSAIRPSCRWCRSRVIAFGTLSAFPIFATVHDETGRAGVPQLRAVDRRAGGMVVPVLCRFGGADHGDRHRRDRRDRHPAAGDRRGSAQSDLARHLSAPVGSADPRLLDADNSRPALDRDQPVAFDLFRNRGTAGGFRAGGASPGSRAAGCMVSARWCRRLLEFDRLHAALLPHPQLRGALARRRARRGGGHGRDRDPEGRVCDLYRRVVVLPDGLRRARHHPHLPVMDVYFMDGGAARRGGRGRTCRTGGSTSGSVHSRRRRAARLQPRADRGRWRGRSGAARPDRQRRLPPNSGSRRR